MQFNCLVNRGGVEMLIYNATLIYFGITMPVTKSKKRVRLNKILKPSIWTAEEAQREKMDRRKGNRYHNEVGTDPLSKDWKSEAEVSFRTIMGSERLRAGRTMQEVRRTVEREVELEKKYKLAQNPPVTIIGKDGQRYIYAHHPTKKPKLP